VNYVKACVATAFEPAIKDGITAALEDAKEEAGLGAPEETPVTKLAYNKDEKERDTFIVNITNSIIQEPEIGSKFVTYQTYVVRIGSSGDEKKGKEFYVNGQYFNIRYGQLAKVPNKLRNDFKNDKDKRLWLFLHHTKLVEHAASVLPRNQETKPNTIQLCMIIFIMYFKHYHIQNL